ncbi:MAG TPA: dockerin type I repeat-containing protein, partial [Candidatus Sumerlaeota bacterium]|nr:dockerin type I repeat-containing protein [Candidatus Sumerlaeota bacterium]
MKFYDTVPARLPVDYSDTGLLCISIECMQGDLNGDQVVDSADVILALKIAVGLITPTDCQMQSGDINGDGVIDSADALMIQRLSVGLPINPPQERKG